MERVTTIAPGVDMPRLGLGVFRAGDDTSAAVHHALAAGYRHIDTAAICGALGVRECDARASAKRRYNAEHERTAEAPIQGDRNEAAVGEGLRRSGVPRSDVFITTKLWNEDHGYDAALRAFEASLERLGVAYVDLYLIHWPVSERRHESWRALQALLRSGRARAIGVSNYTERHLTELLDRTDVVPAVNQVEVHPFLPQPALRAFCEGQGIHVVAYSPLAKARFLDHPILVDVANDLRRSVAQVLIRWGLEEGLTVLPKSSNPERIASNAQVYDFALTAEHRTRLHTLADGIRTAWDPTDVP